MLTTAQTTARQVLTSAEQFDTGLYIDLHGIRRDAAELLWTLQAFEGEISPLGFKLTAKGEALRDLALLGV
jgi:hypothetical protein